MKSLFVFDDPVIVRRLYIIRTRGAFDTGSVYVLRSTKPLAKGSANRLLSTLVVIITSSVACPLLCLSGTVGAARDRDAEKPSCHSSGPMDPSATHSVFFGFLYASPV